MQDETLAPAGVGEVADNGTGIIYSDRCRIEVARRRGQRAERSGAIGKAVLRTHALAGDIVLPYDGADGVDGLQRGRAGARKIERAEAAMIVDEAVL